MGERLRAWFQKHWDRHSWWIKPLGWIVGLGKGIYWLFIHWSWVVAVIGGAAAIFGHLNDPRITDSLVAGLLAFTCILILTRGLPRPPPLSTRLPTVATQPPAPPKPVQPMQITSRVLSGKMIGADFSQWDLVDKLQIREVALLWSGVDPSTHFNLTPEGYPVALALKQAIAAGTLSAVNGEELIFSRFQDIPDDTLLYRDELVRYAESKNKKPDFLFPDERFPF